MESLEMNNFWKGKKVFVTGHTGFKGSWLSLWLQKLGAEVTGYSLQPPTTPNLFEIASVGNEMTSIIGDILDKANLLIAIQNAKPEIVIHMAAQPIVRYSFLHPVETFEVNILGTINLLESLRNITSCKSVLVVTSDKCYENKEWIWSYREIDKMGGKDPYSSSKACVELITASYRDSFFKYNNISVATARSGNVIGGGDWASDRLIPDIINSIINRKKIMVRYPLAVRPWQHVLEPLSGYLKLAENLFLYGDKFSEAWNFGPIDSDSKSVRWIVDNLISKWGSGEWDVDSGFNYEEANYLKLDISKSLNLLNWYPKWKLSHSLDRVIYWHKAFLANQDMRLFCFNEIENHIQTELI